MGAEVVITLSQAERPEDAPLAAALAAELGAEVVARRGRTLGKLLREEDAAGAVAVGADGPVWHGPDGEVFFFHPNMAVSRLRCVDKGQPDLLLRATRVEPGDRVLDCTLGLAADAIVLSHVVGDGGRVLGIERSPLIAALVRYGLATYEHKYAEAMRRIEVVTGDHRAHLLERSPLATSGWDVICFDPMFDRPVAESVGIAALRRLAAPDRPAPETIRAARALVTKAVVVKVRRGDPWLDELAPDERVESRRGSVVYAVFSPESGSNA